MKKILLATTFGLIAATASFAGTKYNPEVSGETCELVQVMSELNPGTVLYSYRADPTCGNVRTGKDFTMTFDLIKDKEGNVIGTKVTKTVTNEENNGG